MAGDEQMIKAWPLPTTNEDDAPFWQAAQRGEVAIQACSDCGELRFPPRPMCPHCRSLKHEWRKVSGRGTIWSYTIPHPPLLPAFNDQAPYNVIVVELDDAPNIRLVGNLVTGPDDPLNAVDPATVKIGERVRAIAVPMAEDVSLVRWVRAPGNA
jgi:uncharacterized OB-fold protein